ncbi:MAG: hypothetical protein GYA57_22140 [Myxococcales bacterium]|nr:hypothetical protein [Myxococcales bacterium]
MEPERDDEGRGRREDPAEEGGGDEARAPVEDGRDAGDPVGGEPDPIEEEFERRPEEEEGLPPPPDDGPFRVLPVRHLRLADEPGERSAGEVAGGPATAGRSEAPGRAWQWVPLGALLALLTTTVVSALFAAALPRSQEALQRTTEAVVGVESDEEKLEVVRSILDGPDGPALVEALVGILVVFAGGLLLAGTIVGLVGRAGAVEAGLGAATFALLSMLFVGGGLSPWALPTPLLAFGLGWLGGRLGLAIRGYRARRRGS